MTEIRAQDIEVGQVVREFGMDDEIVVTGLGRHGDTVLVKSVDDEYSFDIDTVLEARPGLWKLELPGYGELSAYISPRDHVLVVEIDTPEATFENGNADFDTRPKIRINVNDDAVWENPPLP